MDAGRFGIRSVRVVTRRTRTPRSRTMTQILSLTRRDKLSFIVFGLLIATTFLF